MGNKAQKAKKIAEGVVKAAKVVVAIAGAVGAAKAVSDKKN